MPARPKAALCRAEGPPPTLIRRDPIAGPQSIIPISPARTHLTSLARLADHPSSPGCMRRKTPGQRAHRGPRQRDTLL